jgi:hypothetical protein
MLAYSWPEVALGAGYGGNLVDPVYYWPRIGSDERTVSGSRLLPSFNELAAALEAPQIWLE